MDELNREYLTVRVAVVVPGLQALVNGCFYGLAVLGLVVVANHMKFLDVPAWAVSLVIFSVSGWWKWTELLQDWRYFHYGIEDQQEPEPVKTAQIIEPVRVEISSNNGRQLQFMDLPASQDQLIALGAGLVGGSTFTEARWVGGNAPFKRSEFVQLRDELIRRGMARWNSDHDTARGVAITGKGNALMRHFASMTVHPPTLSKRK